ncbi:MAG TPA: hypothetical protein VK714_02420 [Myxococcota bacterium]|nr:hypothetical protein [Myxococcota bacterium]
MTVASSALTFASALALALLLAGPGRALDEPTSHDLSADARSAESDARAHAALPIMCAPRRGSPAGAAAGFGLAIAAAAVLSRRRMDGLR